MIGILNYGLGNVRAFYNIYKSLGIPCRLISKNNELINVDKIILPGVGAFDFAMRKFNNSNLRNTVERMVIDKQVPVLGICVGMQMLSDSSDEGIEKGLGWIKGNVKKINIKSIKHAPKLPHMGWNNISLKTKNILFNNFDKNPNFYFLHSYYFKCDNENHIISETNYGKKITSAINDCNIYGVQFHPEKSHNNGIKLLYNFSKI